MQEREAEKRERERGRGREREGERGRGRPCLSRPGRPIQQPTRLLLVCWVGSGRKQLEEAIHQRHAMHQCPLTPSKALADSKRPRGGVGGCLRGFPGLRGNCRAERSCCPPPLLPPPTLFLLVLLISPLSDGYQSLGKCTQEGCAYILSSSLPPFSGREVLRPLP